MLRPTPWLFLALLFVLPACDDVAPPQEGACVADSRECVDPFNYRVCKPDQSGYDFGVCPETAACVNGLCTPGARPNNDTGNNGPGNNGPGNNGANNGPGNNGGNNGPGNNGSGNNGANNGPGNNGANNGNNGNNVDTAGPCEPFSRECVNGSLLKLCRGDGTAYDLGTCPPDQPCEGGYCNDGRAGTPGTCEPGFRSCLDSRTVRICKPRGDAWDNQTCPTGFVCETGTCRELVDCVDNDRDGYGTGAGCLGPDCDDSQFLLNPEGQERCGNNIDEDCDGIDPPCDCDPVAQNCPGDRLKCSLNRDQQFECQSDGILGEGELCGGIPSNCGRGMLCLLVGQGNESVCTRICDPRRPQDSCPGDSLCGATLNGRDDVGLCVNAQRCDPVDSPELCQQGQQCQPISDRGGICFDGGGNLSEGAPCQPGNDQCGRGMTCLQFSGDNAGNRCAPWCKPARGNADCNGRVGGACTPIEYSFTFNGTTTQITSYGICN